VPVNRRLRLLAAGSLVLGLMACGAAEPSADVTPGESPSTANTPTPTPTPTPEPRKFTLVATGDVLLHERLWNQARDDAARTGNEPMDFAPQLANIKPVVESASLAICHLETPLAPADGPYEGYPSFSGPPQIVPALLATGYDACTTASNHTFDQAAGGVDRTLDALDAAGIAHAGSARTPEEAARSTLIDVPTTEGPVTLGLLSYAYGFNGIPYPNGETWRSNEIDGAAILTAAAAARKEGAEFVVVAMHWGTEYDQTPNAQQLDLAPRLIASPDIDLLLGHHAHVVQPVENVDGEWVVYGMGNLMAAHRTPGEPQNEGLLVLFTMTEDLATGQFATTAAQYLPLLQTDQFPVEVLDVPAALAGGDTGTATVSRLETALARTTDVVTSRGGSEHGLTPLASR
jgi:poly-gamma-glutamate synthesis protein (capsule biosynthesis protein)